MSSYRKSGFRTSLARPKRAIVRMLGVDRRDVAESSVSKHMVHCHKPPSQTWRTFLENHVQQLVSIDFFTVPTVHFQVLYVFLVLAHNRRRASAFQCYRPPNRGMDSPATAGGLSLCQ